MKKSIFCCLLCFLMLFSASCSISLTNGSVKESIIEETFDNLIKIEDSPNYFVLDEEVRLEISACVGRDWYYDCCYYGEYEGKHVFYRTCSFGANGVVYVGPFKIFGLGVPDLFIWDGNKFTNFGGSYACNIFSFETSRKIAIIHANHLWNSCSNNVYPYCRFEEKRLIHKLPSNELWRQISGDYIKLPDGEYELKNYCVEQEPLFSGKLGVVDCDMGILPEEFRESDSYVVTIENTVGYEEKFTFYGTVASVEEMYQITEDMWLDSYEGFNQTGEFDLEKAKTLKYCVPVMVSAPNELNVETCIVTDNLKDSAYLLVFNVNEQTGEKYISQVYEYEKNA